MIQPEGMIQPKLTTKRLISLLLVGLGKGLDGSLDWTSWATLLLVKDTDDTGEVSVGDDDTSLTLAGLDDVLAVAITEGVTAHDHVRSAVEDKLVARGTELVEVIIVGPTRKEGG